MEEDIETLEDLKNIFIHLKNYGWVNDIKRDVVADKVIKALENLIARNKELEEDKKYAELTKISCCTAQNCEALNNAIREGIENQKLREEIEDRKYDMEVNYIPKSKIEEFLKRSKIVTNESTNKTYFLIDVTEIRQELLQEGDK